MLHWFYYCTEHLVSYFRKYFVNCWKYFRMSAQNIQMNWNLNLVPMNNTLCSLLLFDISSNTKFKSGIMLIGIKIYAIFHLESLKSDHKRHQYTLYCVYIWTWTWKKKSHWVFYFPFNAALCADVLSICT